MKEYYGPAVVEQNDLVSLTPIVSPSGVKYVVGCKKALLSFQYQSFLQKPAERKASAGDSVPLYPVNVSSGF
jgi:hypothetical protein